MAMRVNGIHSTLDDDDDGGLAATRRYNEYIESIRPDLPASVSALLDVSVHDSHVANWTLRHGVFVLTFITENIVENVSRLTLTFFDAEVAANDTESIETLRLTDGSTELLTSEFDVLHEGRFRYQIMMTPTGELSVTFSECAIERSVATIDEWRELATRPDTGRWGRWSDAWFGALPPLHRAAALGDLDEVLRLLSAGADVGEIDEETGWTALHAAASRVRLEVMDALLKGAVPIDQLDAVGQTATGVAASDHDQAGLARLIEAGADLDLGADGWFPLSNAAGWGYADNITCLLKGGADPNRHDSAGWTALMTAAESDHRLAVLALLEGGADSTLKTDDGRTAGVIARERGLAAVANLIDRHASSRPID